MISKRNFSKGFSLIELLIALAVFSVIISVTYSLFRNQVSAHNTNRAVVSMQQNIRAALDFMERDIRMAGYDPTGASGARILVANGAELQFQIDQNENGSIDVGETIRYVLSNDAAGDGIADGTPCNLARDTGSGLQVLARNIDALNFDYFDVNGNNITNKGGTPWIVPAGQISDISSIQISIIARSGETVPGLFSRHTDSTIYRNRSNDVILPAQNDQFRRMQMTTEIDCRNL